MFQQRATVLLLLCISISSWGEASEEFRLWEIQNKSMESVGHLLGVIDYFPLAATTQEAEAILNQYFPAAIDAVEKSNPIVVENPYPLGFQPSESLDHLILNCDRGLGSFLDSHHMQMAKEKLLPVLGEESIYYRYVHCLNPMYAVFAEQLVVTGGDIDTFRGTILDAVIGHGVDRGKSFHYLEENEGEESYLTLPASVQRKNTYRWLFRDEQFVLDRMHVREYDYYRRQVLGCYLKSEECRPLDTEKQFLSARYAPGAFPDNGVNREIQVAAGVQRNHCWLSEILELLSMSGITPLFAVGLYHLEGSEGLVALLRSSGYILKPVKMR